MKFENSTQLGYSLNKYSFIFFLFSMTFSFHRLAFGEVFTPEHAAKEWLTKKNRLFAIYIEAPNDATICDFYEDIALIFKEKRNLGFSSGQYFYPFGHYFCKYFLPESGKINRYSSHAQKAMPSIRKKLIHFLYKDLDTYFSKGEELSNTANPFPIIKLREEVRGLAIRGHKRAYIEGGFGQFTLNDRLILLSQIRSRLAQLLLADPLSSLYCLPLLLFFETKTKQG